MKNLKVSIFVLTMSLLSQSTFAEGIDLGRDAVDAMTEKLSQNDMTCFEININRPAHFGSLRIVDNSQGRPDFTFVDFFNYKDKTQRCLKIRNHSAPVTSITVELYKTQRDVDALREITAAQGESASIDDLNELDFLVRKITAMQIRIVRDVPNASHSNKGLPPAAVDYLMNQQMVPGATTRF